MPNTFLLSPSENDLADLLPDEAINSPLPEQKGADILLYTDAGLFGWQRKKVPNDFISSVTDGRFTRLLPLLSKSCAFCRIIQEGEFKFWPDQTVHLGMMRGTGGKPVRVPSRFTRRQIHGILNDIEIIWDVPVRVTCDLEDTALYLRSVRDFLSAKRHTGMHTRPKVKGNWYVPTAEETQLWLLQGFGGIGPATADKIIRHFGRIPLCWTCSAEQLSQVGGISLKDAREWIELLQKLPKRSAAIEENFEKTYGAADGFDNLRKRLGK
jgi:ERCC4-type nuclease